MKRGSDLVRRPAHSRDYRAESGSPKKTSVGGALLKARNDLVVRRFICVILLILLLAGVIAIAYNGYFGKLIQYLMDRLL